MEPSDPTAGSMRPSSVPSWMSELKGQPGVPALPPRQRAAHLIDGAAPTSRPRAPIVTQKTQATKPVRRPRRRSAPTKKERAPPRSLTESWESLRLFGRKNLGRRLEEGDEASDHVHFVNCDTTQEEASSLFSVKEVVENSDGHLEAQPSSMFVIPELPRGRELLLNVLSTWGDPHYVGLAGFEVFDERGELVPVEDVWADPPDINVLPGNEDDPRVVENLLDGVNHTGDDLHAWLAPFTRGQHHHVGLRFTRTTTIAMVRLWNYNKSRIHSYRGVRYAEMTLDNRAIFKGEIRRASGPLTDDCSECILFTTDEETLRRIEQNDRCATPTTPPPRVSSAEYRPGASAAVTRAAKPAVRESTPDAWTDERPKTSCGNRGASRNRKKRPAHVSAPREAYKASSSLSLDISSKPLQRREIVKASTPVAMRSRPSTAQPHRTTDLPRGRRLELRILSNWGDPSFVGLAGLEVLDENFEVLKTPSHTSLRGLRSSPPGSPARLEGAEENQEDTIGDLDQLAAPPQVSTDPSTMWAVSTQRVAATLRILVDLGQSTTIGALKVWNYNAGLEGTYVGVRRLAVTLDGRRLSPPEGFLIRKAPGNDSFDFGQFVDFSPGSTSVNTPVHKQGRRFDEVSFNKENDHQSVLSEADWDDESMLMESLSGVSVARVAPNNVCLVPQQYETPLFPCGCIFKLCLLSTHGDGHYVGLSGAWSASVNQHAIAARHAWRAGLELADAEGRVIPIDAECVHAEPRDLNVLPENESRKDARTLDKLIDGKNEGEEKHSWLAPFTETNAIFVCFDAAVAISRLTLWNYAKTPARGVRELDVFVDDVLVYRGVLKRAPEASQGQTVLFTNAQPVVESERHRIYNDVEESCLFIDEGSVVVESSDQRPRTAVYA